MHKDHFREYIKALAVYGLLCAVLRCLFYSGCSNNSKTKVTKKDLHYQNEFLCHFSQYNLKSMLENWSAEKRSSLDGLSFVGQIPQKTDVISDGPHYFLYRDGNNENLYIIKTLGFLGDSMNIYGPFILYSWEINLEPIRITRNNET